MGDSLARISDFNLISGNDKIRRPLDDVLVKLYRDLIDEEANVELDNAFDEGDLEEVLDALGDTIVVAAGCIHSLGFDPVEILTEIMDSNMSKFCYSETDAIASVDAYAGDERYHDVHFQIKEGVYVILGKKPSGDGWKILKGINYREPNLKKFTRK